MRTHLRFLLSLVPAIGAAVVCHSAALAAPSGVQAASPPPPAPATTAPPAAIKPIDPATLAISTPADPKDEDVYKSALQWLKRGQQYASVAKSLKEIVARNPYVARYKEAMGDALVSQALDQWAATLPDAAGLRRPRTNMGDAQQLYRQGLQQIEEAVQLQPNVPDFDETLGWAHLANTRSGIGGDIAKSRQRALQAFNDAIRLNPQETVYSQALGDLYRLNPELGDTPAPPAAPASSKSDASKPAAAPRKLSPGVEAYRRASAARPRDAGLHFFLYQSYQKAGDADGALQELMRAQQADRSNAVPLYLMAGIYFDREAESRGQPSEDDWRTKAFQTLQQAGETAGFVLDPYRPAYPLVLAPALRRALGDSLTLETLDLYDRLKSLSNRVNQEGDARQVNGDPGSAEGAYQSSFILGQRLIASAMGATGRYLLHLPELSTGMTIEETALSNLRTLYDKYAMTDRLPWMQQQQIALDQVRQMVKQGADDATPVDPQNQGTGGSARLESGP